MVQWLARRSLCALRLAGTSFLKLMHILLGANKEMRFFATRCSADIKSECKVLRLCENVCKAYEKRYLYSITVCIIFPPELKM